MALAEQPITVLSSAPLADNPSLSGQPVLPVLAAATRVDSSLPFLLSSDAATFEVPPTLSENTATDEVPQTLSENTATDTAGFPTDALPQALPLIASSIIQSYCVVVHTSDVEDAGTDANVNLVLCGSLGYSDITELLDCEEHHKKFQQNQVDTFQILCNSLGALQKIKIGLGVGVRPGWHLDRVEVTDVLLGTKWMFHCQRLLEKSAVLEAAPLITGGAVAKSSSIAGMAVAAVKQNSLSLVSQSEPTKKGSRKSLPNIRTPRGILLESIGGHETLHDCLKLLTLAPKELVIRQTHLVSLLVYSRHFFPCALFSRLHIYIYI